LCSIVTNPDADSSRAAHCARGNAVLYGSVTVSEEDLSAAEKRGTCKLCRRAGISTGVPDDCPAFIYGVSFPAVALETEGADTSVG
jgi:hypothetical protein